MIDTKAEKEHGMIYAFDVDGTITRYPDRFRALMAALVRSGETVWVLTGTNDTGSPEETVIGNRQDQLAEHDILINEHYEKILSPAADSHDGVADQKARLCQAHGIDVVIDNDPKYCERIRRASPDTTVLRVE